MIPVSTNNRGVWNWIPVANVTPPSMTIAESQKDALYHSLWLRYFLSKQTTEWVSYMRESYKANLEYAIDSRWGELDDVRVYLGDSAAQTSRIPFKFPIMSPMLTRLVGAVDNISITPEAKSTTPYYAQTRMEEDLMKALLLSEAASTGPMMASVYEDEGISPDPQRTEQFFNMTYQDHVIRGVTGIMKMMAERSKLDETKRTVAAFMALSGLGAAHCSMNGNNLEWEICSPDEVGFDQTALRPDASDGQYMYICPLMDVSAIGERWNPQRDKILALDKWARVLPNGVNLNQGWPQSRPRVFTMYWKDMKEVERGFVEKNGYKEYCTINEINPDTGKPDYTDKDLVDPPSNKYTDTWTATELRNKKQKRIIEVIRYCSAIPWEYLPGGYTANRKFALDLKPKAADNGRPALDITGDMILDYGVYPLQEADPDDVFSVKFPIKISMWRYLGGHVVAPLTAAIDPQRWMNQVTSDIAWRLRKAGGKSMVIAQEAVAESDYDLDEINSAHKEGDIIALPAAQLGGLQNSTATFDSSPGADIFRLLETLPQFKAVAESAVGVYESNYGAPQGNGQLVGTLELQLQQAGVMQQPFYACIADLYRQIHQFNAQAGKDFYSRREWLLSQMVGDQDAIVLTDIAEMQIEQFRVKVDLSPSGAQTQLMVDTQLIPQLMQLGMLDPVTASQLLGRSAPQDVYAASRQFTKQAAAAAQAQQEAMAAQAQQEAFTNEQAEIDKQQSELTQSEMRAEENMAKLDQKLQQPMAQANADWMKPGALDLGK